MSPALTAILSTFTASDGANLAIYDWPLDEGALERGLVLVVHGLGEHAGRYELLAAHLNGEGFAVRGFDQYGHGESDGARGRLSSPTRLLDDLGDVVASARARLPPALPLVLLGHSMGGLVASWHVAQGLTPVQALVLSSPAIEAGLGPVQKFLLATLPWVAPNLAVGNGLDPQFISHDVDVVAAYLADPSVHDRISGRLARFILEGGPHVLAHAPTWTLPTLLMYAGSDRLVDAAGSRAFAAAAPPDVVSAHCFESLYHELFNELDAAPVFACLRGWLDARFPRAAGGPARAGQGP